METKSSDFLDVSAFLELERGVNGKANKKDLDGVEAALLASLNADEDQKSSKQQPPYQPRVTKASLDKIAAAAKAGSMTSFASLRNDTKLSMQLIRTLQERIFDEHMKFDVFEKQEVELNSKDFLPRFADQHEEKEKVMHSIAKSLAELATHVTDVSGQIIGVVDPLSQGNSSSSSSSTAAPKMSLKTLSTKIMEKNRVERAKEQTAFRDVVEDVKVMERVNETMSQQKRNSTLVDFPGI